MTEDIIESAQAELLHNTPLEDAIRLRYDFMFALKAIGKEVKPSFKQLITAVGIKQNVRNEIETEINQGEEKIPVLIMAIINNKSTVKYLLEDPVEVHVGKKVINLPSSEILKGTPELIPNPEDIVLLKEVKEKITVLLPAKK